MKNKIIQKLIFSYLIFAILKFRNIGRSTFKLREVQLFDFFIYGIFSFFLIIRALKFRFFFSILTLQFFIIFQI